MVYKIYDISDIKNSKLDILYGKKDTLHVVLNKISYKSYQISYIRNKKAYIEYIFSI